MKGLKRTPRLCPVIILIIKFLFIIQGQWIYYLAVQNYES